MVADDELTVLMGVRGLMLNDWFPFTATKSERLGKVPFMGFPESPPVHKISFYEHLKPFIYTTKLRFSYGQIKGTFESESISQWSRPPLNIKLLKEKGFTAVLVDRLGFEDEGRAVEKQLLEEVGDKKLESLDRRFLCWLL